MMRQEQPWNTADLIGEGPTTFGSGGRERLGPEVTICLLSIVIAHLWASEASDQALNGGVWFLGTIHLEALGPGEGA